MQTMNWKKTEVEGARQLPCVSLSKELNRQKSCLEANHARSVCVLVCQPFPVCGHTVIGLLTQPG